MRNKAHQERSSMNGKVRPNGKQSRRSITHTNSWSASLMRRLNDFLVMPQFRLETRLRTVHDGKRKTEKGHLAAAIVLHLIMAGRFFELFLNQFFPDGKIHLIIRIITSLSSSFLSPTQLIQLFCRWRGFQSSIVFFHVQYAFVILPVNIANIDVLYRK